MSKKAGLLVLILVLGFLVRLYRINNPIGDWHAWRQADTSSVSRNFVKNGFDVLHPKYEDISNIQSGKDNPEGYRMVEFPIFNAFQAGLTVLFPFLSLEVWGRLVSVFFSLGSILFIYLIVKKHGSESSALFSSAFFALLPYSIYFGRTILPDGAMASTVLGSIYFFDLWVSAKKISININFLLAALFAASALLLKPFAIFFVLPMLVIAHKRFGIKMFLNLKLYLFLALSITPLLWWRWWIYRFPQGIPVSDWLFNGGNVRFRPSFFRWILYERLTKLILGFAGLIIAIPGILRINKEKNYLFFLSFAVSSILYVVIVARGNLQHDYYQIPIIPALSIFLGRGADFILEKFKNRLVVVGLITVCIIMFVLSWNQVKDYFNINRRDLIEAGQEADKILPRDAKVIAANDGDTSFLYYVNRKGWPALEHSIDEMVIKLGATHMVIASPTKNDFTGLGKSYKIVALSDKYLILDLRK